MKRIFIVLTILLFVSFAHSQNKFQYPKTKKVDVTDNYFGADVADPYRWLEDDNSEETKEWVRQQNEVTFSYLNSIPHKAKLKQRITELYNYPKYSNPTKEGGQYYYYKNDGLQNQSVIYRQATLESEPEIFLDPNKLSDDGTVALKGLSFSKDGKLCAYSVGSGGSDWSEIFLMDVSTKKKMSDHLKWVKFSGMAWKDNGFYYSRFPEPTGSELSSKNEFMKIYYHKIGDEQANDKLIYEDNSKPTRFFNASTSNDEKYLFVYFSDGTDNNGLLVKDLSKPNSEFITLVAEPNSNYSVVDNIDDKIFLQTDRNAPNYKLMLIDLKNPNEENWIELIAENKNVLEWVTIIGGKLITHYRQDVASHIYVHKIDGKFEYEVELPGIGSIGGFSGKKEDSEAFYSFTSFTFPSVIYRFDVASGKSTLYRRTELDFNFDDYETKQVFYESKDGTKIPMFVVHKKGLKLDGSNPCYLYSYGGFNISMNPSFSSTRLVLLENGFVFAMPNIRGGGEYGEEWHKAGMKTKKQNVFDDFISAAEYLIKEGYTSSSKLAIAGGSNGGLLVGAVINQRPDLYKVALPAVGVMDMLRFHKFTIGYAWVPEYGSSDDEEMFNYLHGYSPLHTIKTDKNYPAVLVTTADHDDRVVPAHSFKYIATLQEKYKGNNPVMIRIEVKAGHGAGKPTAKIIEEAADLFSFVFENLDVEPIY